MELMARPPSTFGARVTVRLNGVVVSQSMHWPSSRPHVVGAKLTDAVPTPSGNGLVAVHWMGPKRARIVPIEPSAEAGELEPGGCWHWSNDAGVDVDLDLVPLQHAKRRKDDVGGDAALFTLLLMLMVGVAQANMFMQSFMDGVGPTMIQSEPTPEMIARLLERDYDGADEGLAERVQHRAQANQGQSVYMPAGNDGDLARAGGGNKVGDDVQRREPQDGLQKKDQPKVEALASVEQTLPALELQTDEEAEPVPAIASRETPRELQRREEYVPEAVERFVGWGFRDWFDVEDARESRDIERMERILEVARVRLRIDPDDPTALITLGHFAYLSENPELVRTTYGRYNELYPDDPAGYNNLALSYKRSGEYEFEEALYRQALALDPFDVHVLNNLAVNLAHQGRFDEALGIMVDLEELDPESAYADLHRAKIYAAMGKRERAYRHLRDALEAMAALDTFHHIEFRQDIRVDPAFDSLRDERRFARLLHRYYGEDADYLLQSPDSRRSRGGGDRGGLQMMSSRSSRG